MVMVLVYDVRMESVAHDELVGFEVKAQALTLVYLVRIKIQVLPQVDFMSGDRVEVLLPVHAGFDQRLVQFMGVNRFANEFNKVSGDFNENDYRDDQSSNPINKRVVFLCT